MSESHQIFDRVTTLEANVGALHDSVRGLATTVGETNAAVAEIKSLVSGVGKTETSTLPEAKSVNVVSTSEAPDNDETRRLPCLAMGAPTEAATSAAIVEMLTECDRSPPVPTTSRRSAWPWAIRPGTSSA